MENTVYYSAAVRYTITANSQKINHNQDQRQPIVAAISTIIASTHNQKSGTSVAHSQITQAVHTAQM